MTTLTRWIFFKRRITSYFHKSVVVHHWDVLESVIYENSYFHLSLKTSGCRHLLIDGKKHLPLDLIILKSSDQSLIKIEFVGAYNKVKKQIHLPLYYCEPKVKLPKSSLTKPIFDQNVTVITQLPDLTQRKRLMFLNKFYKSHFGAKSKLPIIKKTDALKSDIDIFKELEHKLQNNHYETN